MNSLVPYKQDLAEGKVQEDLKSINRKIEEMLHSTVMDLHHACSAYLNNMSNMKGFIDVQRTRIEHCKAVLRQALEKGTAGHSPPTQEQIQMAMEDLQKIRNEVNSNQTEMEAQLAAGNYLELVPNKTFTKLQENLRSGQLHYVRTCSLKPTDVQLTLQADAGLYVGRSIDIKIVPSKFDILHDSKYTELLLCQITDGSSNYIATKLIPSSDQTTGVHSLRFIPRSPGKYRAKVELYREDVTNSPMTFTVESGDGVGGSRGPVSTSSSLDEHVRSHLSNLTLEPQDSLTAVACSIDDRPGSANGMSNSHSVGSITISENQQMRGQMQSAASESSECPTGVLLPGIPCNEPPRYPPPEGSSVDQNQQAQNEMFRPSVGLRARAHLRGGPCVSDRIQRSWNDEYKASQRPTGFSSGGERKSESSTPYSEAVVEEKSEEKVKVETTTENSREIRLVAGRDVQTRQEKQAATAGKGKSLETENWDSSSEEKENVGNVKRENFTEMKRGATRNSWQDEVWDKDEKENAGTARSRRENFEEKRLSGGKNRVQVRRAASSGGSEGSWEYNWERPGPSLSERGGQEDSISKGSFLSDN